MELVLKTKTRGAHGQPDGCSVGVTSTGLVVFEDVYRGISGVITDADQPFTAVILADATAEDAVAAVVAGYFCSFDYLSHHVFKVPNALMSELRA